MQKEDLNVLPGIVADGLIRRSRYVVKKRMLSSLRPALEAEGDWEEIAGLVHETLQSGNGATRQRAAYERNERHEDVVAFIVEETKL